MKLVSMSMPLIKLSEWIVARNRKYGACTPYFKITVIESSTKNQRRSRYCDKAKSRFENTILGVLILLLENIMPKTRGIVAYAYTYILAKNRASQSSEHHSP